MTVRGVSADAARRLALGAQGFGRPRVTGRVDRRHVRRAMDDLRLLQVDSVNVCVRSHYMPLFSRLGPYRAQLIDEMVYRDRAYFEYWGHVASIIPVELYPAMRHRMETRGPWPQVAELLTEDRLAADRLVDEIAERGPLSVSEITDPGERTGPWWGWGPGKELLEWLFATGRLAVTERRNFARVYDLPERVIPAEHREAPGLPTDEAYRVLALDGLRGLGIASAADIADYWRLNVPRLRPVLRDLVEAGEIEPVSVAGWTAPAFVDPRLTVPRRVEGAALLTPFDPIVWRRQRAEALFGFHYRIEIYVPEPKRRYGYYVYPFLLDGELVGRVDLKAHRERGVLEARSSWIEDGRDPRRVAEALAAELGVMAAWLGLDHVEAAPKGNLASDLTKAL